MTATSLRAELVFCSTADNRFTLLLLVNLSVCVVGNISDGLYFIYKIFFFSLLNLSLDLDKTVLNVIVLSCFELKKELCN